MFSSFIVAAKYRDLVAVVTLAWRALTPSPGSEAPVVANAIAQAVLEDDTQGPYDRETKAALLAVFAFRESALQAHPCLHSKLPTCGDSGAAHGYWQLHQPAGEDVAVRQAQVWLALLRESAARCPERPLAMVASGFCDRGTRLAESRLKVAEAAVSTWRQTSYAERPAEAAQAAGETAPPLPAAAIAPPAGGSLTKASAE